MRSLPMPAYLTITLPITDGEMEIGTRFLGQTPGSYGRLVSPQGVTCRKRLKVVRERNLTSPPRGIVAAMPISHHLAEVSSRRQIDWPTDPSASTPPTPLYLLSLSAPRGEQFGGGVFFCLPQHRIALLAFSLHMRNPLVSGNVRARKADVQTRPPIVRFPVHRELQPQITVLHIPPRPVRSTTDSTGKL